MGVEVRRGPGVVRVLSISVRFCVGYRERNEYPLDQSIVLRRCGGGVCRELRRVASEWTPLSRDTTVALPQPLLRPPRIVRAGLYPPP